MANLFGKLLGTAGAVKKKGVQQCSL